MGTYNSGCAKIEVPVLNQDPNGPMLMVSHANTNPGLTKAWDPGEPDKYYPTGKRNYARVVTTDDFQGSRGRAVRGQGPQGQEVLRPQRQPDLRPGRRQGVRRRGDQAGHQHPRQPAVGRQAAQLHRAVPEHQGEEPRLHLPRRHLRQQRWPADQGQGRRPRRQHQGQADRPRTASPATRTWTSCRGPGHVPDLRRPHDRPAAYRRWRRRQAARRLQGQVRQGTGQQLPALRRRGATQVILAAIAKSDGTRKGVTAAVLGGAGITIPQADSVTRQGDQDRPRDRRRERQGHHRRGSSRATPRPSSRPVS